MTGAKSREELIAEKAKLDNANAKIVHLQKAVENLGRAGYIMSEIHKRISAGQVNLDDIVAVQAAAQSLAACGGRMGQALLTSEVQVAELETPAGSGLIIA